LTARATSAVHYGYQPQLGDRRAAASGWLHGVAKAFGCGIHQMRDTLSRLDIIVPGQGPILRLDRGGKGVPAERGNSALYRPRSLRLSSDGDSRSGFVTYDR
jgi:hypothetical protein